MKSPSLQELSAEEMKLLYKIAKSIGKGSWWALEKDKAYCLICDSQYICRYSDPGARIEIAKHMRKHLTLKVFL